MRTRNAPVHRPPPQSARQEPGQSQRFLRRGRAPRSSERSTRRCASAPSPTPARAARSRSRRDGIDEPQFHLSSGAANASACLPGNKEFVAGDGIDKPKGKAAAAVRAREGAGSGDGEDAFSFALTEEEFLDILFEDLELPDLVKASLKDAKREANSAAPGTPATARRPTSPCCARCATAWAAAWRCAGRARPRSSGSKRSSRPCARQSRPQRARRAAAHR